MTVTNATDGKKTALKVDDRLSEALIWTSERKTNAPIVLFMIPGNPGVVDFYLKFLQAVYTECDRKINIVSVSHMGHTIGSHTEENGDPSRDYSLKEQIDHKVACFDVIRAEFDNQAKYIIAGHSVGAYIACELLKARPAHNIKEVYALFPTMTHIARSRNGRMMWPMFTPIGRNILGLLAEFLQRVLPRAVRVNLIKIATSLPELEATYVCDSFLHKTTIRNALAMAHDEMDAIKELDGQLFDKNGALFMCYYGVEDGWVPAVHQMEMASRLPEGRVHLCSDGLPHAFVIGHSQAMGVKVSGWINNLSRE